MLLGKKNVKMIQDIAVVQQHVTMSVLLPQHQLPQMLYKVNLQNITEIDRKKVKREWRQNCRACHCKGHNRDVYVNAT